MKIIHGVSTIRHYALCLEFAIKTLNILDKAGKLDSHLDPGCFKTLKDYAKSIIDSGESIEYILNTGIDGMGELKVKGMYPLDETSRQDLKSIYLMK